MAEKQEDAPKVGRLHESWRKATAYFRLLLSPGYTFVDVILLCGGVIGGIATGIPFPLLGILFGELINNLNSTGCNDTVADHSTLEHQVRTKVLQVIYVTIANWCFIYIHSCCWSLLGERLVRRLREKYLRSLLRQELSFFDTLPAGDVSSRLSTDLEAIQTGTSEKVGICIGSVSYFVASYVVAFIKDAKLAGMLVSLVPAYFLMTFIGSHFIKKYSGRVSDNIALATSIASESLSKIQLVQAFGAGARLEAKFAEYLDVARKEAFKKAITAAVQLGLLYFIAYSTNALAYWQGSRDIAAGVASGTGASKVGAVYTVIFLLIDASFILSQVAPFLQIFGSAASAAEKLNGAINRNSLIDGTSTTVGKPIESVGGQIDFENVSFAYPGRPDTTVLKGISLSIPANKHTAIVGQSGSGKSTVAALTGRLYDPAEGQIRLDGVDVRELNVRQLRGCIGTVQQDPSLLDRSILENIAHGLINSRKASEDEVLKIMDGSLARLVKNVQDGQNIHDALNSADDVIKSLVDQVKEAARLADALEFISRLEHGLATSVGAAGSQLSGGQKQRIALARAMVREPRILLLDEATSSLDSRSERLIQGALERATLGRTTISIVHRLSTIKNADNIIVMRSGKIIEQGSHQELTAQDGVYASMVRLQTVSNPASGESISDTEITQVDEAMSVVEEEFNQPSEKIESRSLAQEMDPNDKDEKALSAPAPADSSAGSKRGVWSTITGIVSQTRSQAVYLLIALTSSAIVGGSYSGEAVIFGHTISSFSTCNTAESIRHDGAFFGLMFFILAAIEFFANVSSGSLFGLVSENTLYKIRVKSLRTLLGQDLQWHESEGRTPATLLSFITSDANALAGLTGTILGTLFSIIVNTIAGIILSHIIAWRIAVVLLATLPVLIGAGMMRLRVFAKFHAKHQKAFAKATGVAVEAVNSIRTISIFSLENEAVAVYHRELKPPYDETRKAILWSNVWLASAYSVSNLVYALAYWWGSQNIIEGRYSQTQFFIVLPALLFSAQTCGQLFALAPDFSKSRVSAARILDLLAIGKTERSNMPPDMRLDSSSSSGFDEKDLESSMGEKAIAKAAPDTGARITFRDVRFSYPARPNMQVLKGLTMDIKPGQFCALVGPSGAGKSTIIALLERFYRPTSGRVELDNRDVGKFCDSSFRDSISLVPQESVMFEGTLRFNLSLGARPGHDVTDAEIENACRMANIHDTIAALPDGYDTRCGPNGSQFSGGQKQRLSIARALLRKPRLLLLDESTSALDSESEKMVQDALENVRKGITVIAIAHRLHTIEKADCIFVIEDGNCTARGTHKELLSKSETYRTNALHQVLGD
ncbi:hypothetical protein AAFC00_005052 [Neodothiora populina]|uniref:Uncharacterized protein n=1 Tax=Neodothiora populina TaxID=2781224 RepID=A0ABR3PJU8_9PEZI